MSFYDGLIYNAIAEKTLTFTIEAQAGDIVNCHAIPYDEGGIATILWGDGAIGTSSGSSGQLLSHEYESNGKYKLSVACTGAGLQRLYFDGSTANIISSNEKWFYHPQLGGVSFANCNTSALDFQLLPESLIKLDYAFNSSSSAFLNIKRLPQGVANMNGAFYRCTNALLPFKELPQGVTTAINAFSGCVSATSTVTALPSTLTNAAGLFYRCSKMDIRLNALPAALTSLKQTFDQSAAVINLDEVVSNAPNGGFTSLVDISGAFYSAPGVTGSRSRFLAACPNLQSNDNAFIGTNTTD